MNRRYVARPFAMISARSTRYTVAFFCSPHARARELTRSRAQISNLPPNPHILTRHRSTAEVRVVGIETSCIESLTEEPSAEWNDLAMSRLHTRETIISPYVGLAPSLIVCTSTRKKKTAVLLPRVLGTHWVHTLGHLESTNSPACVAATSVSNCL